MRCLVMNVLLGLRVRIGELAAVLDLVVSFLAYCSKRKYVWILYL